jgi:hypothetical protein
MLSISVAVFWDISSSALAETDHRNIPTYCHIHLQHFIPNKAVCIHLNKINKKNMFVSRRIFVNRPAYHITLNLRVWVRWGYYYWFRLPK